MHWYDPWLLPLLTGISVMLAVVLGWAIRMRRRMQRHQQVERALNDQLAFMRALVNGTPHPIYVRDAAGRLQTCNDSYLQTFSVTRDQVIGHDVLHSAWQTKEQALAFHRDYQQVMATGMPLIRDRPLRIGVRQLTIYHWVLPFHDSQGVVRGIIGGWVDISERLQLLDDLRVAKCQADSANSAKSRFLATMSHEIRTPMNAIIGLLELELKRPGRSPEQTQPLHAAHSSAQDLLALIGDILDLASIESGHLSLSTQPVHLGQLVTSVSNVFEGLARQKGITLHLALCTQADGWFLLDPLRFKQVLSNLVSNAIKFTKHGHVTLRVEVPAPLVDGASAHLCISVEDTGIGISELDQASLFEPFTQLEQGAQVASSGTGLGLVISRRLCRIMGAKLTLHSTLGVGTRACIQLPWSAQQVDPACIEPPSVAPALSPGLRILVVDDHPANRLLLTQQLRFLGLEPEVASDGLEALDRWLDSHFDAVILDCNMPLMNGYELTEAIRQYERRLHLSPCIVLGCTANAQPSEQVRCQEAGMDDCLFKPLDLQRLAHHLAQVRPLAQSPLDWRSIIKLTGGEVHLQRRLLTEVLSSCRSDREHFITLDSGDHSAVLSACHRIRGAARMIRACAVSSACAALEATTPQTSPAQMQGLRDNLVQALDELAQAVQGCLD